MKDTALALFHKYDVLINTRGDALVAFRVEARVPGTGAVVPIYSDENGTPIVAVSGIANTAITDAAGNFSLFVEEGTYDLRYFDPNGKFVGMTRQVPMQNGTKGQDGLGSPPQRIDYRAVAGQTRFPPTGDFTGTGFTYDPDTLAVFVDGLLAKPGSYSAAGDLAAIVFTTPMTGDELVSFNSYISTGAPPAPVINPDTRPRSAINSFLPLLTWLTSYNQATGGQTLFYDFGSSVGNGAALKQPGNTPQQNAALAAANNPGAYFFAKAKAFFDPTNIYNFTRINGSEDTTALIQMRTKWNDVIAPAKPVVSFGVPGMNDFQIGSFNTGETFDPLNGSPRILRDILRKAQQSGCVVALSTTPHPHIGRVNYDFFETNPNVPQYYPTVVNAPVPASSVIPRKEDARPFIIWKGVSIQVDARFLRGNEMIRRVAAEFGVPVVDAERKQFDLLAAGYTYDDMYDENDPSNPNDDETVHPNLWTIQQTYHAATDDLFDGMRNDSVLAAQPSAIGPRLGVNADETMPYAVRVSPTNGDGLLLLEKEDGTDLLTIDANGNLDQVAGDTARLAPLVKRRTSVDPSLGVPQDTFAGAVNTSLAQSTTVPPNSHGFIWIGSFRSDLGRRTALVAFYADSTTVTVGAEFGGVGTPVTPIYNTSTSGLTITVTPTGANTTLKLRQADVW